MNSRELAVKTLLRVNREGAYSNLETKKVLARKDYKEEDKGLYLNMVYGVLQNKLYLDYLLSKYVKKPLDELDPKVLEILRTAVYQVYFLDKIPEYAVVNEAVTMTGKLQPRAKGFVNGVLRNVLRNKEKDRVFNPEDFDNEKDALSVRYSIPLWIVHKYYEAFGVEKAEKILPMMNDKPPFTIRVNVLKTGREALRQALLEKGITSEMGSCDASALKLLDVGAFESHVQKDNLFTEGFFTIQDQGAMVAARLLAPEPGERVLDMCAAPGGKTTHLAELMGNTGEIIARDVFASRITLIEDTAKRLGITIIKTEEKDGSIFDEAEQNTYDRILLDAPCTGLGIIRRKPEIRYGMGKKDRQAIVKLQAKLLDHAVAYLKPGGTMVYATCTVNPDENEKQIVKLLEKYPFMSVHHEVGCDGRLHTTPLDDGCDGRLHTTPLDDGCDGFFMCKLVKDHGVN